MLSLICSVNFDPGQLTAGDREFAKSLNSYANLAEDRHLDNLRDHKPIWNAFLTGLKSAGDSAEENCLKLDKLKASLGPASPELVSMAVSCLQLFVQVNWLGPLPNEILNLPSLIAERQAASEQTLHDEVFNLSEHFTPRSQEFETFQELIRDLLTIDGETVYSIIKCSHLILFAKIVFVDLADHFNQIPFFKWWSLRTIYIYQQLFEERSSTLSAITIKTLDELKISFDAENPQSLATQLDKKVFRVSSIVYHLEAGHFYYQIYSWTKGQESFKKALELSNLNFELIGLYGKRTKYQQKDIAQLFLKLNKPESNQSSIEQHSDNTFLNNLTYTNENLDRRYLPKNIALNDDVLLDKTKISNKRDEELLSTNANVSQLEQIILYCCLFDFQKNNPHHELTTEEMMPFIENLLSTPQNWCIQVCTLFMRAKMESKKSRKMERSLYQLEALSDNYKQPNQEPSVKYRLPYFYSVSFPSFWTFQVELAKMYMRLGLLNSSLDIYLNLKMWNDVITCYHSLDKKDKAEEIIRQQLSLKETPDLYCSLGEVTKDISHFKKAIELSKGRSARAFRMLAKFQFSKEQYEDAIVNFEKSLEINSMQYDAWFMLGSAAFRSEKWPVAVKAYRSCCELDPENHQNWNNLAAAYIKNNQKDKAYTVLQEALKHDYENWKIWENYLWTCTDCGYFEDLIKAYHRLLDLKEKYVDIDVLDALCKSVRKNLTDPNDVSIRKYKQKILELFGRITSLVPNEWKVYWFYADIVLNLSTNHNDDANNNDNIKLDEPLAEKYFGLLQKAFRNLYNQTNWELSVDKCKEMVDYSTQLLTTRDTFGSFNLSVKSIINKLKQKYQVDSDDLESGKYFKLVYLKDLNTEFVNLQIEYEHFVNNFFT